MHRPSMLLSLLLAALLGPACATSPPAPAAPAEVPPGERTFLWEVKSAQEPGGLMYLVGSIHVAREGELDLPPAMMAALFLAEALVVEVDVGAVDPSTLRQFILEHGLLPEDERLSERLDPETAKLLAAVIERSGLPGEGLERMRPWVVALTLPTLSQQRASHAAGPGVEMLFLNQARGRMPIVELETAEEQLRVFSELPEPVQEWMLRDQLLRLDEHGAELERIMAAWKAGDVEAMEAELFQREQESPELRTLNEKLFYERNERMAEKLEAMLAQRRVWCVVVGAGHLVGPRGLLALLREQGHRVRRLPKKN